MFNQQTLAQLKTQYKKHQENLERRRKNAKVRRTKKRFAKTMEQLQSYGLNPLDLVPKPMDPSSFMTTTTTSKTGKTLKRNPQIKSITTKQTAGAKKQMTADTLNMNDPNFMKFMYAQMQKQQMHPQKRTRAQIEDDDESDDGVEDDSEDDVNEPAPKRVMTYPKGSQNARDYMQYVRSFRTSPG